MSQSNLYIPDELQTKIWRIYYSTNVLEQIKQMRHNKFTKIVQHIEINYDISLTDDEKKKQLYGT